MMGYKEKQGEKDNYLRCLWYSIWLKNSKSFMFNVLKQSFIYTMHNLYPSFDFDASNSQKLH